MKTAMVGLGFGVVLGLVACGQSPVGSDPSSLSAQAISFPSLSVSPSSVTVGRFGFQEVTLTLRRPRGVTAPVIVSAVNPPNGVSVPPASFEQVSETTETTTVNVANFAATTPQTVITLEARLPDKSLLESTTLTLRIPAPGSADTSFASSGVAQDSVFCHGNGLLFPNDKILTAKAGSSRATLCKFDANGQPDLAFGTNGRATIEFNDLSGTGSGDGIVALASDGKIVTAVGQAQIDGIAVARVLGNGQLDSSFDGDGVRLQALSGGASYIVSSIGVQSDLRVVVAGTRLVNSERKGFIVRFNANGALDTAFGVNGQVIFDPRDLQAINDLRVVTNDRLLIVGRRVRLGDYDPVIGRVLPSGILDASFDGGLVARGFGSLVEEFTHVRVASNGRIVASGNRYSSSLNDLLNPFSSNPEKGIVGRFTSSGAADDGFSGNGELIVEGSEALRLEGTALQPDDKILVGTLFGATDLVRRIGTTGTLESGAGFVAALANDMGRLKTVLVDSQGRIVVTSTQGVQRFFP
jgi:uncharacterized delta-60 repeat protein